MKLIKIFITDIYLDLLIFSIFLLYSLSFFNDDKTLQIISLTLSLAFVGLWILARINLGSAFRVMPEARTLVTRGLYSKFRHPIYLFSSLSYLSLMFIVNSKIIYLTGGIFSVVQVYRAKLEGTKLREMFSEEYDKYRRKTLF